MSNACSSNWRSMSLYFIAARACTCTQIHRDSPVTSHCITVMVFQSRYSIHSIFMNVPHCCFFLFPRLVGVSESLGYPRLPPLHIPFPEARGRGVTCNCQHLPTNKLRTKYWAQRFTKHSPSGEIAPCLWLWEPDAKRRHEMTPTNIEQIWNLKNVSGTVRVTQLPDSSFWCAAQKSANFASAATRSYMRADNELRHGNMLAICWQWWQCNVDMFSQRVSNAKQSHGPCGRCRRCSWPFSTGWGNTMEHMHHGTHSKKMLTSRFLQVSSMRTNLRPSKGRKLAWQGAWHENTMMLRMRMLPICCR